MSRRIRFKPSHAATLRANDAAQRFYAATAGIDPPAELLNSIAPKRERAAPRQLEALVVQAISELLSVHPKILVAWRMNSGQASYEAKSGKYAPVVFHRWLKPKSGMRMPDFLGLTVEKHACGLWTRPIAIEAKAGPWTKPRDDREREQAAFLAMIRGAGGIALFATDASQVAEALR